MIRLHRLREEHAFALNPDLFERIDVTPDTTIVLVDGSKYIVRESLDEVLHLIMKYRAEVIRLSHQMEEGTYDDDTDPEPTRPVGGGATVLPFPRGN